MMDVRYREGLTVVRYKQHELHQSISSVFNKINPTSEASLIHCGGDQDLDALAFVLPVQHVPLVNYTDCFDLEGYIQSIETCGQSVQLIIVTGITELLQQEKVHNYALAHKLFNEGMLKTRKLCSQGGKYALFMELEQREKKPTMLEYYCDVR